MSVFSENLKILRKNSSLKQSEMADFVGVTSSTWSNYEVGKSEPSIEIIVKISNILKVSIDSLVTSDLSTIAKTDSESKDFKALVNTLEDLVKSKNEIIQLLKFRIDELEAAFKQVNEKLKEQEHV